MGLDTNILARYYIDDEGDKGAEKQREISRSLIESGNDLMVCKTVLLEFVWVMRGYYRFKMKDILHVFQHLLSLEHVIIEDRNLIERAISSLEEGVDFADALHHSSYYQCEGMLSFDDRKFARRLNKLAIMPRVIVPK
jgi:predicted nucleic-acid-binding protein